MNTVPWGGVIASPLTSTKRGFEIVLGKMLQPNSSTVTDIEMPYLKSASVQWDGVRADDEITMWSSPEEARALMVKPGDLMVCEGGDVGRAAIYNGSTGFIFQNSLHRIRARGGNDVRYLKYVLESVHGSGWFDVLTNKATIRHLTGEKLGALEIPLPLGDEQRRIADFLDAETARIDAVTAAIRHSMRLLDERRQSALEEAFGDIEGTAVRLPLRRVIDRWIDYRGATPEKTASGIPLVTAKNISNGSIDLLAAPEFIDKSNYDEWMRRGLPCVGDVLMTTEAPLGEVALVTDANIALAQRIILMRVDRSKVASAWLYWYLRSPQGQYELFSRATGSTALGIKADRLYSVPLPLFAKHVMTERVAVLEQRLDKLDLLGDLACREVALLSERRQALITAAVTGQLDVTTACDIDMLGVA